MRQMLSRSGEVGRDLLLVDWDATSVGQPETWPRSLESVVRLVLTSRFSMWMAWGPDLTFFCNEAYRRDTLGKKYPWALGRPASEVWSEIWPDVGPRIKAVMTTGVSTWDESLLLFLERSGYTEETYHTFSYSPLFDDSGLISGMLCVVKEDTEQVVSHRRMQTLRDLGSRRGSNLTEAETIETACRELGASPQDLPFSLVYLLDDQGTTAHLAGSSGFDGPHPAAPERLDASGDTTPWPLAEAAAGRATLVDLAERFERLPTGAWDAPPLQALVVPLTAGTQARPYGFLVCGLNRFRPLDDGYRDFCDLVAGQLAASLTDARAYEFERRRAETLAELDQAKTDFFTNVSHEFRTPLTLLLGPAEDALADEREPLPPRQQNRVEVVLRNAQRLLKLVNTLLDFSRLESGRVEARFEPVDLAQYTRELSAMFETAAERLGLELVLDLPPLPEPVYVDRDLWAKVVLNLLSNAVKFTFEGPVTVALSTTADGARLLVSDTGTGIPHHELPHLFERFHRVTGARSRTHEGSGIGLALVAELVELHGGTVTATSEPDEGSTFVVTLPLGSGHLPAEQVAASAGGVSATVAAVAEGFLAEAEHWADDRPGRGADDRAGAEADPARSSGPPPSPRPRRPRARSPRGSWSSTTTPTSASTSPACSAATTSCTPPSTGSTGWSGHASCPPDLVLTDVMMPRMDGFQLLAALQADPVTVGIPVVMLSARAGEEGTVSGLDAGADDYLVKPFTARELRARVRSNVELDRARRTRRQLERSRSLMDQAQRLASVGSWEVDLSTGRIEASDEFLRIVGRTAEQVAAMVYPDAVTELVHPDDAERVLEALAASEGVLHVEARLVRPDGQAVLVAVHGEVVRDDDGREVLGGSVQDITERRAAEEALALAAANAEAAAREHTDSRPAPAQPAPAAGVRPRPPRGGDLLPGRRRGHPGRR